MTWNLSFSSHHYETDAVPAAAAAAAGTDAVDAAEIDAVASDYGFGAVETAVQLTLCA